MSSLTKILLVLISIASISCAQQKKLADHNKIDSDLDGIHDNRDACPMEPGSIFNLGCPDSTQLALKFNESASTDSDLDGVEDSKDECPYEYGSPFNQGCPFE